MNMNRLNFCPHCGKKLQGVYLTQLNYCCFCGSKLNEERRVLKSTVQCPICHKYIGLKGERKIKCSYCGSQYHSGCISSWLIKYNSCPVCLNEFLIPKSLLVQVNK